MSDPTPDPTDAEPTDADAPAPDAEASGPPAADAPDMLLDPVPLEVAQVDGAGGRVRVGLGRIDRLGRLSIDVPDPDCAAYAAALADRLNGMEAVILKLPPLPDQPPSGLRKVRVERGDPEFPARLKTHALQVFSVALDFDAAALADPGAAPG
ncbi:MAG: hypothetical protein VYD87_10315 [Pseudomonadota bacterium]|nr:hypothetical protein [Pseudomonadota bacterium]